MGTEEDITETERVSQAKTDFVSTASHQLRTPLSIMRWYSELLLGGEGGKPSKKQSEYLNEILQGARRMADLIDALLTVSRIELGTFSVELKDTDVSALAASVKGDFVPIIAAKKLILTERYAEGLPHMRTDSRLLHAIYYNLLSNAVKYSHEGGTITIDIHAVEAGDEVSGKIVPEKSLVCSVSDTGYGIPEFQKMLIFTKFFRADNARINVPDGTGLGLYIVKSLVEYMKGMIWFESTENKGTTFYVVLPLAGTLAKEGATRLS
ncbi:MAG: HAMP domain-containing sensor histidine kinase [Candidatus Uhrbacteria bacterium]|nr:HAMP domain-containing sensor histidine kinase [Candidatus Uhrbacteria bacterium]